MTPPPQHPLVAAVNSSRQQQEEGTGGSTSTSKKNQKKNDKKNDDAMVVDSDTDTSLPEGEAAAAGTNKGANKSAHPGEPATSTGRTGGTKRSQRAARKKGTPPPRKKKKKSKKKKKKAAASSADGDDDGPGEDLDPEQEFETVWICSECKEAECLINPDANVLLICDGPCRRLFHYPCVGLAEVPPDDISWLCPDCQSQTHRCAICQEYGRDSFEVFPCSKKSCGLFFHEACLAIHNVDVVEQHHHHPKPATPTTAAGAMAAASSSATEETSAAEDAASSTAATTAPSSPVAPAPRHLKFDCAAHSCWTCFQTDLKEQEKSGNAKQRAEKKANRAKRGGLGSFECKSERFLYRCIECPRAYHSSCIPPMARFHELALLCHEHADQYKLPDLDVENSFQNIIEQKVDKKYETYNQRQARRQKRAAAGEPEEEEEEDNMFLPGLSGDALSSREERYYELVAKYRGNDPEFADGVQDEGWFCLPCNIKDEVYSKPPSYRHIHSNRYDPNHRPAKIVTSGEICQCIGFCGDDCLNRMLYLECHGDSSKGDKRVGNCRVGPNCGNRRLGQRKFKKCQPAREHGKGWGLKAMEKILKGELVQEYVGEIIDAKEKEKRLKEWTEEHPNDPNFYVMELLPGWFIDARNEACLSRFINHSCDPNCDLHRINVGGYMRNGIFANRDIQAGEFLSYDYQFDTKLDRFVCRCGAKNCRGNMRGGPVASANAAAKKSKAEVWEEAKAKYERDKKFVSEHYEDEESRRSQVAATVPNAENAAETVANGAQGRFRNEAIRGRIFLWRNASRGSDFVSRLSRLEEKLR